MLKHRSLLRSVGALAGIGLVSISLTACSGSGGASDKTEISFLTATDAQSVQAGNDYIAAFEKQNPTIKVTLNATLIGGEGDNLIKTQLSTGEMSDVFNYNTGSLFQALNPDTLLVDLSDQAWASEMTDDFKSVVSTKIGMYGAPVGTSFGGGVLYNKKVYEKLGLSVPTSWDEFMANSQKIKSEAPDVAPVIQAYGDTWTSQLFVLADYANVAAQDPKWAADYTANKAKYADQPALAGFEHLAEAYAAGLFNEDFASMTNDQALKLLATGGGAQYAMQTNQVGAIQQNNPDELNDVGFFALPADDAADTQATVWQPNALYIPKSSTGDKLAAAKKFVEFVSASEEGCAIQNRTGIPGGPYATTACTLTGEQPPMVTDLSTYFEAEKTAPALEFLSPVKGPNLENITVQVGSGISSAEEGAALYDDDVKKQAQQLGLEGW